MNEWGERKQKHGRWESNEWERSSGMAPTNPRTWYSVATATVLHTVDPTAEVLPASQARQAVAPVAAANVSATQATQAVLPVDAFDDPAGHAVHASGPPLASGVPVAPAGQAQKVGSFVHTCGRGVCVRWRGEGGTKTDTRR